MNKSIAFILSFILAAGILSGCAKESDITKKEQVEIFINVPILTIDCISKPELQDSSELIKYAFDSFAAQYDKYDVTLRGGKVSNFEQTDYQSNIPDAYGTDNCPDLSFGGYFAMSGYIYDGYVIPLDDIITDEIRSDFAQATWDISKGSNGKTYLMPFYALQNILCYNKDLFSQCGLDKYISDEKVIQHFSLDEWDEILSTLKEKLPSHSYPMMMYAKNNQGDTHTMIQLRCMGSEFFDENGLFNLNTPEGIAALKWLKSNYDRGFYPDNCEDLEISDCLDLFTNSQLAICVWNSSLDAGFNGFNLGYVNFPGSTPDGVNSNWITGFMAFDNGDEKKIEVVKDFLKYIYETPEMLDLSTSGQPCSISVSNRWADKLPLGQELSKNEIYSVDFTANNPNWADVRSIFYVHIHSLLDGSKSAEEVAKLIDEDCNKAINSSVRVLHE